MPARLLPPFSPLDAFATGVRWQKYADLTWEPSDKWDEHDLVLQYEAKKEAALGKREPYVLLQLSSFDGGVEVKLPVVALPPEFEPMQMEVDGDGGDADGGLWCNGRHDCLRGDRRWPRLLQDGPAARGR